MIETLFGVPGGLKHINKVLLLCLLFLLALSIRSFNMDKVPFSTGEARLVSNALNISRGEAIAGSSTQSYIALTSMIYFLTKPSVFWARFWPVLFGSSLVFLPWCWRERFSSRSVLLIAVALALDPILVTISRQADGSMLLIAFLGWGGTCLYKKKYKLAGIFLALTIFGGYWFGAAVILFLLLILLIMILNHHKTELQERIFDQKLFQYKSVRNLIPAFLLTSAIISSNFFLNPWQLSGATDGILSTINGLREFSLISALWSLPMQFAYSITLFVVGFLGLHRLWRNRPEHKRNLFLLIYFEIIVWIVLMPFGPGRVAFGVIPFIVVSIPQLESYLIEKDQFKQVSRMFFIFSLVILVYLAIGFFYFTGSVADDVIANRFLFRSLTGVVLLGITFLLAGVGWSFKTAKKGIFLAFLTLASLHSISLSTIGNSTKVLNSALVWSDTPVLVFEDTVSDILDGFQKLGTLETSNATVAVINPAAEYLRWYFRDFKNVIFVNGLDSSVLPELIISTSSFEPKLAFPYRGLSVPFSVEPNWIEINIVNFPQNLSMTNFLLKSVDMILWVRGDLFTGVKN